MNNDKENEMSVEDVDRDLRMQERLDVLMRVWGIDNGDCTFAIGYDGCSGHPWSVKVTMNIGSDVDDLPDRVVEGYQEVIYSGETLAHAVESAWRWHRAPLICSACDGAGERPATDDEIAAGKSPDGYLLSTLTTYSGTERTESKAANCTACKGHGILWTGPKL